MNKEDNVDIFYEGEIRTISDAGALLVRKMIEEELGRKVHLLSGTSPYSWLSGMLNKSEATIRRWTYDWNSKSGSAIPFSDFLTLAQLTKSKYAMQFFEKLIDASLEDEANEYSSLVKAIGKELMTVGNKFIDMSEELKK